MNKQWVGSLLVVLLVLAPGLGNAAQFSILGPRAMGMGGASVAAVNDATAVYWNPAALAAIRKFDIRFSAELTAQDHIGLKDKWTQINDINAEVQAHDPQAIDQMISLFNELNVPDTGLDADAAGGVLASIPIAKSAIALSGLGFGYAGVYPTVDTLNTNPSPLSAQFVGNNDTSASVFAIRAYEPAVSLATSFGDIVYIGVNAKRIYATSYVDTQRIRDNSFNSFRDDFQKSKVDSTASSLDAGIMIAPFESFRIGVVGRDLNSPTFEYQGIIAMKQASGDVITTNAKGDITFDAQYRAGLSWQPVKSFTIAADCDLSRNNTLTPGFESRTAALGLEKTFFDEIVSLRAGANKNIAETGSKAIYTFGLGLKILAVQLDAAAGYDFNKRQGEASVDLGIRF